MDLSLKLRNSVRSKNSDECVAVLQDIYNVSCESRHSDLEYFVFPSLVQVIIGNVAKREKLLALSTIRNLTLDKQSRLSREIELIAERLVEYILKRDPDFEELSIAILLNLFENEVIFKGLEQRLRDFNQIYSILTERVYQDDALPEYIDLFIAVLTQSGTKVPTDLVSRKITNFTKQLESVRTDEEKVKLFKNLVRTFELSPALKKFARGHPTFRAAVTEHITKNTNLYLEILSKFLEIDFYPPEEILEFVDLTDTYPENRSTIFQILEASIRKSKECGKVITKDFITDIVRLLDEDLEKEGYAAVASLLTALAQQDTFQSTLKQKLKCENVCPLLHRMLSGFCPRSGSASESCDVIHRLLLLVATMSKICGLFFNEFTKLAADQRVLEVLSYALLEGSPQAKSIVLKIAGFIGFDREKFCQIIHEKQSDFVAEPDTPLRRLSVCSSVYEPRLREVTMILECSKDRLSLENTTSELTEIYELQIANLEQRICHLEDNLDKAYNLLVRERAVCAKQFRHLANVNELLSVREVELSEEKEGHMKAVEQINDLEEEKKEVEHRARKEVALLRSHIKELSEKLELTTSDLARTTDEVKKVKKQLQEAKRDEMELKEVHSKLEAQFEAERNARESMKMENVQLLKDLRSETDRVLHLEAELARLKDESKTKDDELLELKRFKQMICELSGASGKKV